jgi:hypothetical protein
MGFKSEAHRNKWKQLVAEGKVTQAAYDVRDKETGDINLPERASPRKRTVGASRAPAQSQFDTALKRYGRY